MSEIKDHLVIPVKPLAITVLNAGALATAAVAATGTVALATMTSGALLTGAAIKGRKQVRKAALRRSGALPTRSRSTSSRSGRAASKLPGLRSSRSKSTGLTPTRGARASKAQSPLRSLGAGLKARGSAVVPKSLRTASAKTRSAVSKTPVARAVKRSATNIGNGLKRAIGLPVSRSHKTQTRPMTKKARSWFRRVILGKKPVKKNSPAAKDIKARVNRAVVNPVIGFDTPLIPSTIKPGSYPIFTSTAPHSAPTSERNGTMKQYAQQMATYAAEYDAPGVLEIIDELDHNLHDALRLVAEAFDSLSETARRKWPFDDAVVQKLSMTGECLWTAANMARQIVPDIETIHAEELRKLRNPDRPGMEKFDLAANGKA